MFLNTFKSFFTLKNMDFFQILTQFVCHRKCCLQPIILYN